MTCLLMRIVGLVTLAMASTCVGVAAQSYQCDTVRPGDTASAVARRLTGRSDSLHQPWFRIVDGATLRVIPKARYDRVLTGWRVCVPSTRLGAPAVPFKPTATSGHDAAMPVVPQPSAAADASTAEAPAREDGPFALAFAFLLPLVFGAAIGLGWQSVERAVANHRSLKRDVERFGDLFVKHFERPLVIDRGGARPIRARLRWTWLDRRLDILLAPAAGHRYPNLEDHRRNVEYDVDRIAHRLRNHPFVRKPLRAEGPWVVVPFQLKPRPQTGDRI